MDALLRFSTLSFESCAAATYHLKICNCRKDRSGWMAVRHVRNNGTMRAHIRSRVGVKTIGDQGFGGCLPYAQRSYKKRSAHSTWEAIVENGTTVSATAVPVLSGSSASPSSSSFMENVARFLWSPLIFPSLSHEMSVPPQRVCH